MNNLSYHLSEIIKENINAINAIRAKTLLIPLKPNFELKLRWEANINKTYWGLTLADNPLSKVQMTKILSNPLPKKLKDSEKEVISYIQTLIYIRENWTASNKLITTKDVLDIYDLSCKSVFGSTANYYKSKEELVAKILTFIESGKENPVIQAGLLQIEIIKLSPFENGTGRVARLLSHLILSKYGYDLRGLLVLEDYYREDLSSLREATETIEKYKNATKWLEYFTLGVKKGMEKVLENILHKNNASASLWRLSNRQKLIMEKLENPNIKITNREVAKMFAVSQITASRDLSKMVNLGILLPHGKGRSVYYTK
ncbi:MAG: Fic family protein [Patescibacteria group bacterium]